MWIVQRNNTKWLFVYFFLSVRTLPVHVWHRLHSWDKGGSGSVHGLFSGWGGGKVYGLFSAVPAFHTCHPQILPVLYPRLQNHLQREALRGSDSCRKVSVIKTRKRASINKENKYTMTYIKAWNILYHALTLRVEFTKEFISVISVKKNNLACYFNHKLNLLLK